MTKQRIYSRDIIVILLASFFYVSSPILINPLITGFAKHIGSTAMLAGVVAGTMNLTSLILRPVGGNLTDRFPKKFLATLGGLGLLIASIGYTIATNVVWLLLFRIVNGVGYVLCTVCMATWLASLLPANKIGSGMGIYGLVSAIGMALAPSLGIYLYQHFGYRVAFVAAIFCGILMIVLVRLVKDDGRPVAKQQKVQKHRMLLVEPKVLPVAAILALFSLPYFATQAYIVSYVATLHLKVAVSLFFPVYAVFLIIIRLSFKSLFDTVAFGKFLYVALGSTLIGLLALSYLRNNWMMIIAALGIAGGYGLMFSICQATALLIVPRSRHGLANSTFYIGLDLGMALGPMVGGLLSSSLPLLWFYPVMLVTLPCIWLVYVTNRHTLNSKYGAED